MELPISPDLCYHGLQSPSPKWSGYMHAVPQVLHAFGNLQHKEMQGIVGTRLEIKLKLDTLNFKYAVFFVFSWLIFWVKMIYDNFFGR